MRMVFMGAASSFTGATPIASASEMRAVLCFAASFCASLITPSAMMPVLCRIACCGISCVMPLSFCVTDLSASIGFGISTATGAESPRATAVAETVGSLPTPCASTAIGLGTGAAETVAPGLRIIGLGGSRTPGLSAFCVGSFRPGRKAPAAVAPGLGGSFKPVAKPGLGGSFKPGLSVAVEVPATGL